MTAAGWIIMSLSVGSVTSLFAWCIYRVLTQQAPEKKLHGIDGIDTQDVDRDSLRP